MRLSKKSNLNSSGESEEAFLLYQYQKSNIYYNSDKVTFSLIGIFCFWRNLKWKKYEFVITVAWNLQRMKAHMWMKSCSVMIVLPTTASHATTAVKPSGQQTA